MKFKALAKTKARRAASICLTGIMTFSLAASGVLAFADIVKKKDTGILDTVNFTDVTGKVDLTKVALQNLSPNVLENVAAKTVKDETRTVIVTLKDENILDSLPEGKSVAQYLSSYQGDKALRGIKASQNNFLNTLSSLGVDYKTVYQYTNVTNAVAIEVNTKYLSKIKSIPNVKYATVSETYAYPEEQVTYTNDSTSDGKTASDLGQSNPSNVYATGIYDTSAYIDKYNGEGMTVAVLDTGLDYTHDAFQKMPTGELGITKNEVEHTVNTASLSAVRLSAGKGKTIGADDLFINDKVPFAYDYADKDTDVYPAYSQHGVHVAGIVAGDANSYTDKNGETAKDEFGNILEFKGAAPNAQLVICKVFTDNFDDPELGGAKSEDIISALEDCVTLGVDVINMSLGTTAGFSTLYIEGDDEGIALAEVYDSIKEAGISLMCAASNDFSSGYGSAFGTNLASNPDSGTVGSPSTFNGAMSVASINGQLSPFMLSNPGTDDQSVIYYTESSDANSVKFDFNKQMLYDESTQIYKQSEIFKYVVIPNIGQTADYTSTIKAEIANKNDGEKVIAVIKRGGNTFKDKVEIAKNMGADAAIIYNNVAGTIGMTLGDLDEPIPAVSVSLDAGNALVNRYENGRKLITGRIEINRSYNAGPFMNDYSSWGTTSDLKIKPEITAHGGEITSAVSGGYDEMSGTSMATPNLAGFTALLRGKLKKEHPDWNAQLLNQRVNQIIMSTAITVYDQEGLACSPRKQGAGLATLDNVFSTKAYLYTVESETEYTIGGVHKDRFYVEDGRPKFELGDDPAKNGVYNVSFYVKNEFGAEKLNFRPQTIFMTEQLSPDGFSVAEKAKYLNGIPAEWTVDGKKISENDTISVDAGGSVKIQVKLTLSAEEKEYLDNTFKNGMYVEGFVKLVSEDKSVQCDLTLPFMGFYGDWKSAPMLDYNAFEIAEFQKDPSYTDETRPKEQVWATQAYASYFNNEYTVPLGAFTYLQDENADQIYVEEEHTAVSCYNVYHGDDANNNYMTTTSIKALYTGLLRNAELVTYDLYDENTGELIMKDRLYRISKAYAGGGGTVPANVKLELSPEELGLSNNGKYRLNFHFYFDAEEETLGVQKDNEFTMTFYVDYEAPILVGSRIRYYDYKENNKEKQKVYLDLDVYDNHYAQSVLLCYSDKEYSAGEAVDSTSLYLATEYITPVYNANKNGTTTVSIEITDFYEKYQNRLYVQLDDYALNHSVYSISFSSSKNSSLPDTFEIDGPTEVTIGVNETYKIALDYEGNANVSNFTWSAVPQRVVKVNNGEIFGMSEGTATVTVSNPVSGVRRTVTVKVVDKDLSLALPSISFDVIENSDKNLVKAIGTVDVNAGKNIKLEIKTDPWYYPYSLNLKWKSSNTEVATVDQKGNVLTLEKRGTARIEATLLDKDGKEMPAYTASVTLNVQDPFRVSNNTLIEYNGLGGKDGVLEIPDDKNIINIGEKAFEDNNNVRVLILPETVRQINEKAFLNCKSLEEVYFISREKQEPANSDLSLILSDAFKGCTSLRKFDLTNCKTITVASRAFMNCTALEEIVAMENIGTMNDYAFAGCTSLKTADITGMHNSGYGVFMDCSSLTSIRTAYYSSIGEAIFKGCGALKEAVINSHVVSEEAFAGCVGLRKVTFGVSDGNIRVVDEYTVGASAFSGCTSLEEVDFNGKKINSLGDSAFAGCTKLSKIDLDAVESFGIKVFENTPINYDGDVYFGAYYNGNVLVQAPSQITSSFAVREGTTEIAPYAFANSRFVSSFMLVLPASVKKIGEYAFARSTVEYIDISESLNEIAAYAFAQSSLKELDVPSSVTQIGVGAFENCAYLASVSFSGTRNQNNYLNLGSSAFKNCKALESIALPELAADKEGRVLLSDYVFEGGASLKNVDIKNVTIIGASAFEACVSLENIDIKNVTAIGASAFKDCAKLSKVSGLGRVTDIGDYSFKNAALGSADISGLKNLGAFAFYGTNVSSVKIPVSLTVFGGGAFANTKNLKAFEVDAGSTEFFAEDGVLYRIVSGTKDSGTYELCAYPMTKLSALSNGVRTYSVKDGTVSIGAYAFTELVKGAVNEMKLPYSIKTISNGAFYKSGISSYVFESIEAPVLLTDVNAETNAMFEAGYTMLYINFEDEFAKYAPSAIGGGGEISKLKISYPTNGKGYDNYVYSKYFGTKVLLGELMNDTTRELKTLIEGLPSANEVAGWTKLDKTDDNLAYVIEFSEKIKNAHAVYNTIKSEKQLEYLGADNLRKLFDIEKELKSVKTYFGIKINISSLSIAEDSAHRTEYKAGEMFDMSGLKIIVNYDDYSTETADMSQVKLVSGYDVPLAPENIYVQVQYQGKKLQIRIVVTSGDTDIKNEEPPKTGCNGCSSETIIGGAGSAIAALGIVSVIVAVSATVKRKRNTDEN